MKTYIAILVVFWTEMGWARSPATRSRAEAEYYAATYASHYQVSINLVRSIIQQESRWQTCAVSRKGAIGLMQLMPQTARRFGVVNRCDARENIAGGVRYLAWLNQRFAGDYRLTVAAYYAGEKVIDRKGLSYGDPDVIAYVRRVRATYQQQQRARTRKEGIQ